MNYFAEIEATVRAALAEDIGTGDITAELIETRTHASARIISRETAVVCGKAWVNEVFKQVDETVEIDWQVDDGDEVQPDDVLLIVHGPARSLLTAERTALNFLQLLSGTATQTRAYVDAVRETGAELLDTRKTIPGLRLAQKYAVKIGGASNHRIGLYDAILIKENHIDAAGSITGAIMRAKQIEAGMRIEVEVENEQQLKEAIAAEPDWIMLDNFSVDEMKAAVKLASNSGIKLEASGGIETKEALLQIAQTGVDYISLGTLTKNCEAIDLSMRFE